MAITLRAASSPADYDAFAALCRDYVGWCRERYAHDTWFVSEVFGYQSLDDELMDLSRKYGPPGGKAMLAFSGNDVAGVGAYRRTSDTVCEMKRLYVSPAFSGQGIGRQLANALFDAARADGYSLMQLDTGTLMKEAIAMYESLGFYRIAPYSVYPEKLLPYLVFMEKPLDGT